MIFTCTAIAGFAQDPLPESPLQQQNVDTDANLKTKLGIKLTLGMHTFRGDAFDNAKLKYGFGMGFYNIIKLNKSQSLNLHWEFNFSFKGSKFNKVNDTSFSKISLSYIELPVMLSVRLFNTPKKKPLHLLAGGQFGVLFISSIDKTFGRYQDVKTDLPFKKTDVMPVLGLRKEIGSGMSLQFCAKYGLRNIWTNKFYERTVNPDLNNQNYDYRDIVPNFKDGSHSVRNVSFELSLMF